MIARWTARLSVANCARRRTLRDWEEMGLILLVPATMAVLLLALFLNWPMGLLRFVALIPVGLIACRHGLWASLAASLLFSTAFVPQLVYSFRYLGVSLVTVDLAAFALFLNLFAYLMADIFEPEYEGRALVKALQDWEALMARTPSIREIQRFILDEASALLDAESTLLVLPNPLETGWQGVTLEGSAPLPGTSEGGGGPTLAAWLVRQREPGVWNQLDREPYPWADPSGALRLRNLLLMPLHGPEGGSLGALVLMNRQQGPFTRADVEAMRAFVDRGERALQQAQIYARTDQALGRRVEELSTIQRAAREIGARLDARTILERTLHYGLRIAGGEEGVVALAAAKNQPVLAEAAGVMAEDVPLERYLSLARQYGEARILPPEARWLRLRPEARVGILAPIRLEARVLGVMLIEAPEGAFDDVSLYALSSLTDYAATALENARLFSEVAREKQRVDLIVQSVAEGLLTTDLAGRILTFNPAAEALTGWRAEEAVGEPWRRILGLGIPDANADGRASRPEGAIERAVAARQAVYVERQVLHPREGAQRVVALSAAPLLDGSGTPYGAAVLFRDVTEQESLERMQQEFIAGASHEMRGPLSKSAMVVDLLRSERGMLEPEEAAPYLDLLAEQNRRLIAFADRMSVVFAMEREKRALTLEPTSIFLVVSDRVRQWRRIAYDHPVRLEASVTSFDLEVWADASGLCRVLDNLLDNAVKYTPAGTEITVRIKRSGDAAEVHVIDRGPGIRPEHQARIFDRFYRVDGGDAQAIYGHGLGLYIAKNLLERMDGDLWVESEPGVGSLFGVRLRIVGAPSE